MTKYNYYQNNHFSNGCSYILFKGITTASNSQQIQNYKFDKTLSVQFSPVHTPVRKGRFISNYSPFANKKYEGIWAADTEYCESVTNVFVNSECAKILDEEYKAYASGNSSAADAVEAAEKKLKIYVSE